MTKNKTISKTETINGITMNNPSKIDAIKQLIFGDNIEQYDSEFQALKEDILNKKKDLLEVIESVSTELHQSIDNLSTDINIRITDLEDSLTDKIDERIKDKVNDLDNKKLDKKVLGQLLVTLGEKISNK